MKSMKPFYFLFAVLFIAIDSKAQIERENPPAADNPKIMISTYRILGKVVDRNNKALEAASVQLYALNSNGQDSLVAGMLTRNNGDFVFENFPKIKKNS